MSSTNGHTPVPPGVDDAIAHERGYRYVTSLAQLNAFEPRFLPRQQRTPGLLIPQYRLGQTPIHAWSLRPDAPRIDDDGKTIKYEHPAGVPPCLDVHPRYCAALNDPTITIWITEGDKKADALASAFGALIVPISINGVWGWRRKGTDGTSLPIEDFDAIAWKNRAVVLAFDNDVIRKPEVQKALKALAKYLKGLGALVRVLLLPDEGEKLGVDDVIAGGMTGPELLALVHDLADLPSNTQADRLLALGLSIELFKTPDGEPYAVCPVGEHREAYAIGERGGGLRHWLVDAYFAEEGKPPSSTALAGVLDVLRARAIIHGRTRDVHTRAAWHNGRLYLDLTNDAHEAIEVDADGWRIVSRPPVIFRRAHGALPLPYPIAGGSLDELRGMLNLSDDDDWYLVAGWLLAPFLPTGAYPHLAIDGEQGSAKTTTTRMLRGLVDPSTAPARSAPKDEQDLAIAARNALVVTCDNASHLSGDLSDALCRLSTGAAFSTRKLYTDDDELVLTFKRPVILNGITEFVTRGDLADRTMMITLRAIPEVERKPERAIMAAYEDARPRLLGALLDAVSMALRHEDMPAPAPLPRMADFALWVERAAPALGWVPGAFIAAYRHMRDDTSGALIEASPIAQHVLNLARDKQRWTGTADELLHELNRMVDIADRPRGWPGTARALGDALRRMAPPAHAAGVNLEFRRSNGSRLWTIRTMDSAEAVPQTVPKCRSSAAENEAIGTGPMASQSHEPLDSADSADIYPSSSVGNNEGEREQEEKSGEIEGKREPGNTAALSALPALERDPMQPINVTRRTARYVDDPAS